MRWSTVAMNLVAFAFIAFGLHGCSQGHNVYGWAVFAGLMTIHVADKS